MTKREEIARMEPGMTAELDGKDYMVLSAYPETECAVFLDLDTQDIIVSRDGRDVCYGSLKELVEHGIAGMLVQALAAQTVADEKNREILHAGLGTEDPELSSEGAAMVTDILAEDILEGLGTYLTEGYLKKSMEQAARTAAGYLHSGEPVMDQASADVDMER